MKTIIILLSAFLLLGCAQDKKEKYFYSKTIKLRQLVKQTTVDKYSRGSFFLIGGSYSSGEIENTSIRVFGRIGGLYRFIEMDMEDIRIKIDNSLAEPNIVIRYWSHDTVSMRELIYEGYSRYYNVVYIINCPEEYLPEKLLPIEL